MNAWIEKAVNTAKSLYQRVEEITQEDVGIPLSEETVNGLIDRYVTQKVSKIEHLYADLDAHDFTLKAHICAKGIDAKLSGRFGVVTFEFNKGVQRMVFLQKSPTQIDDISFDTWYKKPATALALFYVRRVLGRDPLGYALEKLGVAQSKEDLLYFDIGQYFDENSSVIKQLKRFEVTHAFIKDSRLFVRSRINLGGFFQKPDVLITDDDMPPSSSTTHADDQLVFTDVTPSTHRDTIKQYQ